MRLALLLLMLVFVTIIDCQEREEMVVRIDQGLVRGFKDQSKTVYEFHGIPYATAPDVYSKFRAPSPPPAWEGVLNATEADVMCPQMLPSPSGARYVGVEQCLVANVYQPDNGRVDSPVVVYIHGGWFAMRHGNLLAPRTLAERGVVAVTFNYRLGPHGFLCLHTDSVPGNAGLRDQLAALRWVRDNIASFGGNAHDVTLAGYSAGGAAAELLMLSPASAGLFHKVILESGNSAAFWAVDRDPVALARDFARRFLVPNVDDVDGLADFFNSLSYEDMFSKITVEATEFVPCVESGSSNVEIVLPQHPLDTLKNSTYLKLPLMTGYTNADGLLFDRNKERLMREMNANFADHMPTLKYKNNEEKRKLSASVRTFYFGRDEIDETKYLDFVNYFTDIYFAHPIIVSARYHTANQAPVYLYEFNYVDSQELYGKKGVGADHVAQSMHVLDPDYILSGIPNNPSTDDIQMREETISLWTNFIINSDPWPGRWHPLSLDNMNYLCINLTMTSCTWPLPQRMELWDDVWRQIADDSASGINLYVALYVATLFTLFINYRQFH